MTFRPINIAHICEEFAAILGGKPEVSGGACSVSVARTLPVTILGRPAGSTAKLEYAFESMDTSGKALCLSEIAILPEEITPYLSILSRYRIAITALHNHWLYQQPQIMYLHYAAVDEPVRFARIAREASSALKGQA